MTLKLFIKNAIPTVTFWMTFRCSLGDLQKLSYDSMIFPCDQTTILLMQSYRRICSFWSDTALSRKIGVKFYVRWDSYHIDKFVFILTWKISYLQYLLSWSKSDNLPNR